jgi:propanol-preferring alcohol dehydrogenase
MRAMALKRFGAGRVEETLLPRPTPGAGQLLLRVRACGVCRTDLHVLDGDLPNPKLPIVPGHEIVGSVALVGAGVAGFSVDERVGVPWLGWSCGECTYCRGGRENLCEDARFTGYQIDGGYAEYTLADARYCFPLPESFDDMHSAPLLCAGLIGQRAYRMTGNAGTIAIYGFGAAAHIIAQVAHWDGRRVYAFTRPGDHAAQAFARQLGVAWAGGSNQTPPTKADAAIIFAPAGELLPAALEQIVPGGSVVCAGIHMSDIPSFPYRILWQERVVRSVANLTRQDAVDFLSIASRVPIQTHVHPYALARANDALDDLRHGRFSGAAVLLPPGDD